MIIIKDRKKKRSRPYTICPSLPRLLGQWVAEFRRCYMLKFPNVAPSRSKHERERAKAARVIQHQQHLYFFYYTTQTHIHTRGKLKGFSVYNVYIYILKYMYIIVVVVVSKLMGVFSFYPVAPSQPLFSNYIVIFPDILFLYIHLLFLLFFYFCHFYTYLNIINQQ